MDAKVAVPNTKGCRWVGENEKRAEDESRGATLLGEERDANCVASLLIFVHVWINYIAVDQGGTSIRKKDPGSIFF